MPARLENVPSFGSDDACPRDRFTVVVLGNSCVGKTSIISQLLYGSFDDQYRATVEEFHQEEFDMGEITVTLDVIDTTGSYSFPAMRKLCIEKGDAFLLVFSFDNEESFEQIPALLAEIHAHNSKPNRRIFIVGNKSDLVKDAQVNRQVAESLVSLDWELSYVEVSAKENRNFDDLFGKIVGEVVRNGGQNACDESEKKKRKASLPPSVQKCRDALIKRHSCNVS